ncbi:MAG: hypothetical protein V5B44_04210 [Candidatus Accumulibacter necessarius]|uniref:hypothetical protein n=1 Tax=Candidatus Accumulibacter necessarius TaxID=2954386 RepID=UPI002FC3D760
MLNALAAQLPELRITIRSGLPRRRCTRALRLASRTCRQQRLRLRDARRDARRPGRDGAGLPPPACRLGSSGSIVKRASRRTAADLVLSDVAYLPLAGAARAGIPSLAMCSLNWAELFAHFFAASPGRRRFTARCWPRTTAPNASCG